MNATLGTIANLDAGIVPGEIQIHLLRLGEEDGAVPGPELLSLLPLAERDRAGKLGSEERRGEFLWSRLFLRRLLSSYFHEEMGKLDIHLEENGKPFLPGSRLRFNLSHKAGWIVCSLGWGPLGVDMERVDDSPEARERWSLIARRYFSPAQKERLFSLPKGEQSRFFFRIFTLKEARGKMLGVGLSDFTSGFTSLPPSAEVFRSGPYEYFSCSLGKGDHQLAHVFENPIGEPCRYFLTQWTQVSLLGSELLDPILIPSGVA